MEATRRMEDGLLDPLRSVPGVVQALLLPAIVAAAFGVSKVGYVVPNGRTVLFRQAG